MSAIFLNVRFKYCQCVCLSSGGRSDVAAVGAASVSVSVDANVSAAVAVTVSTDPTTPTPSVMRSDFDLQLLFDCLFCSRHNKHQFYVFASVAIKDCCCCCCSSLRRLSPCHVASRRIASASLLGFRFALFADRCSLFFAPDCAVCFAVNISSAQRKLQAEPARCLRRSKLRLRLRLEVAALPFVEFQL